MLIGKLKATASAVVAATALACGAGVYAFQSEDRAPGQRAPREAAAPRERERERERDAPRPRAEAPRERLAEVREERGPDLGGQLDRLVRRARESQERGELENVRATLREIIEVTRRWEQTVGTRPQPADRRSGPFDDPDSLVRRGFLPARQQKPDVDRRIDELERKLDRVLDRLEASEGRPAPAQLNESPPLERPRSPGRLLERRISPEPGPARAERRPRETVTEPEPARIERRPREAVPEPGPARAPRPQEQPALVEEPVAPNPVKPPVPPEAPGPPPKPPIPPAAPAPPVEPDSGSDPNRPV